MAEEGRDGQPNGGYSNPYCYHIDQFESLRPVYMRVIDYCRKMGLDMIQGDHEDSPGQLELNFTFDDALRTADRLATYRQICAQVAREFGIIACFMCKPFMGVSANGCHHNISLWRGGKDERRRSATIPRSFPAWRRTTCTPRAARTPSCPTPTTSSFRARSGSGDRRHRQASRRADRDRLLDSELLSPAVGHGLWAPVFSDWGFQNRTTGLRVSAPGRFEYRAVDAMVNPHLMAAGILKAMDDGLKNKLNPGPSEERNIYQAMEAGKQVKRPPMTLGDALAALEKDDVIRSAMPGEMYRLYDEYKRDEWSASSTL